MKTDSQRRAHAYLELSRLGPNEASRPPKGCLLLYGPRAVFHASVVLDGGSGNVVVCRDLGSVAERTRILKDVDGRSTVLATWEQPSDRHTFAFYLYREGVYSPALRFDSVLTPSQAIAVTAMTARHWRGGVFDPTQAGVLPVADDDPILTEIPW